jgi:RNA polymerase sigma-70 factor (ECF subfamily)
MEDARARERSSDAHHQLVSRFLAGDERAFNDIVLLYQKPVYQVAFRMVRNHQDAQDLAQEVFVRAYSGLKKFKYEASLFTWLYRVTVNLAINFARRERFKQFVSLFDVGDLLPSKDDPQAALQRDELSRQIDQAVVKLPPRQRAVFVLRHYHDLPHAEIAKIVGRTEGAVKANYFQALAKLKKFLRPESLRPVENVSAV